MIKCPECGKSISDKSTACIHCGYPLQSPLKKLIPKLDQLWDAEQWQDCLNVCNEILFINPQDYVAILRLELCRRFIENNPDLGLTAYQKAVKKFCEVPDVSVEDANRFASTIKILFGCLIGRYNKMIELESTLNQMGGQVQRYQMIAPLGSKTSFASSFMYNDAKNNFKAFKEEVEPQTKRWAEIIYREYPKRLANISTIGKEVYERIATNVVIMNPSLRPTVELNHSAALQQQDREQRISEYQSKKANAVSWLWGALVLALFVPILPMINPDLDSSTISVFVMILLSFSAACCIPYFYVESKYSDVKKAARPDDASDDDNDYDVDEN